MEVKDLYFSYEKQNVLNGISIKIKAGKVTTFMGANGCGKSTLFNLMTKNLKADKGYISLQGKSIKNISLKDFSKKVSIVHQYNTAPNDITVNKLVGYGRIPYTNFCKKNKEEDEKIVRWAMEVTNIISLKDKAISELSGGQRQRAWIAMALAQQTKILFLDEPTTYLDIRYQVEILELIRRLNREYGITIVMILHDINQAIYFSDEVVGIKNGKIVMQGTPEDVISENTIKEIYDINLMVEQINNKKFVLTV